jgi:hypothetical protein
MTSTPAISMTRISIAPGGCSHLSDCLEVVWAGPRCSVLEVDLWPIQPIRRTAAEGARA